jgi:phosphatidylinositol glycan class N
MNPVNFDSVFNRSRHTWSWGSPDILPMFQEGAVPGRVEVEMYGAEAEDFTMDAVKLDIWVFDKVKELFGQAKKNSTLDAALRKDKNVFFLHLLGLDTTGHGYRPYSKEYLHNIKVVDQGVREITKLIDNFYDDGKTAYVFTADHGMSDWGSHGDGHPDNTRTPLIAWGSGVAKPVKKSKGKAAGHQDGFSSDWNLDHIQRNDVAQADVAALMAYLAGVPFPVNSVGELPLDYLDATPREKATALLTNAREILEMYRVKEEQKKASAIRYIPYSGFANPKGSINARISEIEKLISKNRAEAAILKCTGLIHTTLEGLRYLQTYDWLFLRLLVTAGYVGWMAFGATSIIDIHVLRGSTKTQRTTATNIFFSSTLVLLFAYLLVQHSPWTYYAYAIFPVFFWEEVFAQRAALTKGRRVLFAKLSLKKDRVYFALQALAFVGLLQALVWSYSNRIVYSICYALAIAWPAVYGVDFLRKNTVVVGMWGVSCFCMSLFTLLPVVKVEDINLILIGGLLTGVVGVLYLIFEDAILGKSAPALSGADSKCVFSLSRTVMGIQLGLIPLAMIVTRSSVASLQAKQGLPLGTQVTGWLVLIASLTSPFLHILDPVSHYLHRLLVIFLAFAPSFILLTISYEGLFYVAFCGTLLTWLRLEQLIYKHTNSQSPVSNGSPATSKTNGIITSKTKKGKSGLQTNLTQSQPLVRPDVSAGESSTYRPLTFSDTRPSLFTLFLLQSAFFSTGNIASISSFSLDAVNRLIPVFDPFSQAALLIFKILVPFIILSATLSILNKRLDIAPGALFMALMVFGDWLTINFFWMVKDEGSWLEIGETISRFCIVSALCVFVAALEGASGWLVGDVVSGEDETLGLFSPIEKENGALKNGAVHGSDAVKDAAISVKSNGKKKSTQANK